MKPNNGASKVAAKEKIADSATRPFPIVGIGASAGGLEALEQFLGNVPPDSGMAFVVIQHLDPTQKGMLPELLQRVSNLAVHQVTDRMTVEPDCVYVIPPNKSMSIVKGVLHLSAPLETRGLRLPIDFFLHSLADDRQELAVGIILSGMGADGSQGIKAIKEKNGIVLVQDPVTAGFDSMPRNALDAVQADGVAPADELPEKLIAIFRHAPVVPSPSAPERQDRSAFEKILLLLKAYTGNDFSLYKKNTIQRRIERRMDVHQIEGIAAYAQFLQDNQKEGEILLKEMLIGVTHFFRDPPVWKKLGEEIFPMMLADRPAGTIIRAWVPGCSTGEEAYSLAIVFKEAREKIAAGGNVSLQIFATDLDAEAIDTARKGLFPKNIADHVSPDRLNRYFIPTNEGYRVGTKIREMVVFAQHNLIAHPPFSKIDILSCRNLLIYLDTELQQKVLGLFYFCLNPKGVMVLGSSETPGAQRTFFTPLDTKLKIYQRNETATPPELRDFPASFYPAQPDDSEKQMAAKPTQNIQTLADRLLLQHFSPIGVLVNENGDIVYTSGRTGKYLEPAVGKANLNIFAMLREGLRDQFPGAFRKAIKTKKAVVLPGIQVVADGQNNTIDLWIQWIGKPAPLNGMLMIVFTDRKDRNDPEVSQKAGKASLDEPPESKSLGELQRLREEMQNALEERQTSEEELKTTNEELQSTNEELQSTNEELMTSKEEMQSMNEELQTLNAELQSKIDDIARVDNDMKNLLNSTDIATLFLDKELNIRRYTDRVTKIFKFIKSDIGRPFTDQVSDLIYPELAADAREVLRTLVFVQKQIPTTDGRWFAVRIMPYRTYDDRIEGLVITFIDLSDLKQAELKLHETEQMNRLLLHSSSDVILQLSTDWKIREFNPEAEKFFAKQRSDMTGQDFIQTCIPKSARPAVERNMNRLLNNAQDGALSFRVMAAGGDSPVVEWSVQVLLNNLKIPVGLILSLKK